MATPRTSHLPHPAPVAHVEDAAAPFREAIRDRCAAHAAAFPYAVDLEAKALAQAYPQIRGVIPHLRGLHSETVWREILLGIKHGPEADLARMCTSPMREAKAWARAKLTVYAAALGYRLLPIDPGTIDATEVTASLSTQAGATVAGLVHALGDGGINASKAEALESGAMRLETFTSRVRAVLHRARRGSEARA